MKRKRKRKLYKQNKKLFEYFALLCLACDWIPCNLVRDFHEECIINLIGVYANFELTFKSQNFKLILHRSSYFAIKIISFSNNKNS